MSVTFTNLSTKDEVNLSMGSADKNGQVTTRDFGSFSASYPNGSRTLPKGGALTLNITGASVTESAQTLTLYKRCKIPVFSDQFIVCSFFCDLSAFKIDDAVSVLNGGKSVSDDDPRAPE